MANPGQVEIMPEDVGYAVGSGAKKLKKNQGFTKKSNKKFLDNMDK